MKLEFTISKNKMIILGVVLVILVMGAYVVANEAGQSHSGAEIDFSGTVIDAQGGLVVES
jgi:hypothetical protein|tara:strand:+ start:484 stop:663 length:180 start_codon:yes stop_codon:yes gene_type:complete